MDFKIMDFIRDHHGILGQIQPGGWVEGGDSACWQGHYVYLTGENFPYVKTFEVSPGAYVRHPDPTVTYNGFGAYYKNPWNGCISRDQWTGVLGALIKQKEYLALFRAILHHGLRGFLFTYNTIKNGTDPKTANWKLPDLTVFDIWATYLRGFGVLSWLFWPLLVVLDIHLLLGTIHVNIDKDNDQINYTLKLMIALEYVPTPISWLCKKILNKDHLLDLLAEYWCGWRQQPGMFKLQRAKLEELLK